MTDQLLKIEEILNVDTTVASPIINHKEPEVIQQMTNNITDVQIPNNKLQVIISSAPIEIVNVQTGAINNIVPNNKKIKLSNMNLYRIPITDKSLVLDNFYTIRHYVKYAEHFRIVSVNNGKVSILPIISGLELKSDEIIGEVI